MAGETLPDGTPSSPEGNWETEKTDDESKGVGVGGDDGVKESAVENSTAKPIEKISDLRPDLCHYILDKKTNLQNLRRWRKGLLC